MADPIHDELPGLRENLKAAPARVREEFDDLSDEQMSFTSDEPIWARWSPETQLRHMANVPCRWLLALCGDLLRGRGYELPQVDLDVIRAGSGRHIPPELCPSRASLYLFIDPLFDLALEILHRESPEDLRALTCERLVDLEAVHADSPDRAIDFWRMAADLHPFGVAEEPERPGVFILELFAVLRQIHWEYLAHLRTVQRIKGLLGLPARVELPREGYITLPKFHD